MEYGKRQTGQTVAGDVQASDGVQSDVVVARVLFEFVVEVEGSVSQPLRTDLGEVATLVVPIDHGGSVGEEGAVGEVGDGGENGELG